MYIHIKFQMYSGASVDLGVPYFETRKYLFALGRKDSHTYTCIYNIYIYICIHTHIIPWLEANYLILAGKGHVNGVPKEIDQEFTIEMVGQNLLMLSGTRFDGCWQPLLALLFGGFANGSPIRF